MQFKSRVAGSRANRPGGSRAGFSDPRPHLVSTVCRRWGGSTNTPLSSRASSASTTCGSCWGHSTHHSVHRRCGAECKAAPRTAEEPGWFSFYTGQRVRKRCCSTLFSSKNVYFFPSYIYISWGFCATDHTRTKTEPQISPLVQQGGGESRRRRLPPPSGTRCTKFSTKGPRARYREQKSLTTSSCPGRRLHNHLENSILTELME